MPLLLSLQNGQNPRPTPHEKCVTQPRKIRDLSLVVLYFGSSSRPRIGNVTEVNMAKVVSCKDVACLLSRETSNDSGARWTPYSNPSTMYKIPRIRTVL